MYLADEVVIRISGDDALTFLQGQLTTDVKSFANNDHSLTAHCSPRGKVVSLGRLIKISDQLFYYLVDASIGEQAVIFLKKFAIFSKVSIERADLAVLYGNNLPSDNECLIRRDDGIDIALIKETKDYKPWSKELLLLNIKAGYPCFSSVLSDMELAQSFNLHELERGISFTKGCYLGQEAIARAKYRGTHKKRMRTFCADNTDAPLAVNLSQYQGQLTVIINGERKETGKIIAIVSDDSNIYVQAIVHSDYDQQHQFFIADLPLRMER